MNWLNFSAEKINILIKEPFTEKYTLTIVTDIMAGNVPIKTKSELRWQFKVIDVNLNYSILEIITLDNRLVECNNPMVKDIASMSQAFSKMYNELIIKVTPTGKVIQILNIDHIRGKWLTLKQEMEDIQSNNASIKNIINVNEKFFTAPEKMVVAIENNEFFMLYFHHFFNLNLPTYTQIYSKRTLLNTADLKWKYYSNQVIDHTNDKEFCINVEGKVDTTINSNWVKESYKDFSHLNLSDLKPQFVESGNYRVEKNTGRLLEAKLIKKEVVHPSLLHATINYHMISDTAATNEKETHLKVEPKVINTQLKPTGFNIIID